MSADTVSWIACGVAVAASALSIFCAWRARVMAREAQAWRKR